MDKIKKVTLATLNTLRKEGVKAAAITAYDYPSAVFADRAGVDWILVGDSGGMCQLGYSNTMPVTMEDMLHFTRAVVRGAKRAFIVGDMPFGSYQVSDEEAVRNAARFMAAGCDAVKLEGGARVGSRIHAITNAGIPVMAHLGLTPQAASQQGGYKAQGTTLAGFKTLMDDLYDVTTAGAAAVLLEAIPEEVAELLCRNEELPIYGIGAGKHTHGQLMIGHDALGTFVGDVNPKFAKRYLNGGDLMEAALSTYVSEVRAKQFPAAEHLYKIKPEEWGKITEMYQIPQGTQPDHVPTTWNQV